MPLDPMAEILLQRMAATEAPPMSEMSPQEAREAYRELTTLAGTPEDVKNVEDRAIDGVPCRVYSAGAGKAPAVLFFHGGGWVIGDLETHDVMCRSLANATGAVVVSVGYRRAPEHRFPAAAEDCFAVTRWVAEHGAAIGADGTRLAVCGDSAGGNLAAVVALRARDEGGPALRTQVLVYPVTDAAMDSASYTENGEGKLLTADVMRWFWAQYAPDAADREHAYASPVRAAELARTAPALVITAEFDPLRDEGEAYAALLEKAGVPVTLHRYDGQVHGFVHLSGFFPQGTAALAEIAAHLNDAFGREHDRETGRDHPTDPAPPADSFAVIFDADTSVGPTPRLRKRSRR